jgi:hypothetical protein
VTDSVKLVAAWRKISSKRSLGQSIAQISLALLFAVGSPAAGIFASYAIKGSNLEVLVKSAYCGFFKGEIFENMSEFVETYAAQVMDASELYARECYRDGDFGKSVPARCNIFIRPKVDFTMEEASCPFQGQCISSTVAFDTGMIDVIPQFGLNMAGNGMRYRIRRTCAVLSSENRTTTVKASDLPPHLLGFTPEPHQKALLVHLGTREGEDPGSPWANATFGIFPHELKMFTLGYV